MANCLECKYCKKNCNLFCFFCDKGVCGDHGRLTPYAYTNIPVCFECATRCIETPGNTQDTLPSLEEREHDEESAEDESTTTGGDSL